MDSCTSCPWYCDRTGCNSPIFGCSIFYQFVPRIRYRLYSTAPWKYPCLILIYTLVIGKPSVIPVITGLGGLLVGIITTRFSPESEGHGTDAVIDAYHNRGGRIRARVPLVKGIASAITLGSGGSGGTEGPAGQIAAGFGSLIGRLFKLDEDERRIAVAAGLGAGIGSIFKVPLGGAIFSAEVFYRRDFEIRALIPGLVASVTGYTIFGFVFGWDRLFNIPFDLVKYTCP